MIVEIPKEDFNQDDNACNSQYERLISKMQLNQLNDLNFTPITLNLVNSRIPRIFLINYQGERITLKLSCYKFEFVISMFNVGTIRQSHSKR